jgi:aspartate/methionine/tyrosine aminotransferase
VPGLRSGFVIGDAALMADFIKLRAYGGATLPMPLQDVAACLWDDEQHVQENRTLYQQKLQYAAALFADVPDFRMPAGGFFLWLPVPARYMNASAAGVPAEAFAKDLWAQQGVRVIPGRYFSLPDASGASPGDHYVRVALVHDLPTTQNALQLMREMY